MQTNSFLNITASMKTKTLLIPFFLLATSLNGFAQNNTATGTSAGLSGSLNSSFGYFAGSKITGGQNTFIGANAGFSTTSGSYNTFLGNGAGYGNVSGNYNTLLGYQAGSGAIGSNNIFIGNQSGSSETGSSKLYIENSSNITNPLIFGDFNTKQVSIACKPYAGYNLTVAGGIKTQSLLASNLNSDYLMLKYSLTFADYDQPTVFLSADTEEMNRYLHVRNSADTEGIMSGVKSGGILVSDDYNFANPSKNDLVSKRSVHIGKYVTTPQGEDPKDYPHTPLYVFNQNSYNHQIAIFDHDFNSKASINVKNTIGELLLGVDTHGESYITSTKGKLNIEASVNIKSLSVNNQSLTSSQWATNGTAIGYTSGNAGIGTGSPGAKLSFSDLTGSADSDGITWYSPAPLAYGIYKTAGAWSAPDYQQLKLSWNTGIILDPGKDYGKSYVDVQGSGLRVTTGNVGIGIAHPTEKLQVNGMVYSTEVKVDLAAGTGPDYVFEPTYHLKPLEEIETYIKENKHLPEVPTAKEMEKNGVQLGEMNMLLLKKVEELTLYMIEQQKINKTQALEIEELKRLIKK
jgi:hypothetical protein